MTRAATTNRPLFGLLAALGVSLFGSNLSLVVIPWYVLQTTGSVTKTGVSMLFALLPVILTSLLGGGWIDRFGFRNSAIVGDIASGICVVAIPVLAATEHLSFPLLAALLFVRGIFDTVGETARQSMLPDVVAPSSYTLDQANSWFESIERTARLVGAPIAGVLIAVLGTANVLWIDAASYGVSALIMLFAVVSKRHKPEAEEAGSMTWKDGLRVIYRDKALLWLSLATMVSNTFEGPLIRVVMPAYADDRFHSSVVLGLMVSALGGGALLGALIYSKLAQRYTRRTIFVVLFAVAAARYLVLLAVLPAPIAIMAILLLSIAEGPLNPLVMAISFERIAPHQRARVIGAAIAIESIGMPIGLGLAGPAIDRLGLTTTLAIAGALYMSFALTLAFIRPIRMFDDPPLYVTDVMTDTTASPLPSAVSGFPGWRRLGLESEARSGWIHAGDGSWQPVELEGSSIAYSWPAEVGWSWVWTSEHGWTAVADPSHVDDADLAIPAA